MQINKHKLFRWFLIVMLTMAPLRGVMALNVSNCQMHDDSSQNLAMTEHSLHEVGMMQQSVKLDQSDTANSSDCCSDGSMICKKDCSIGINVSVILQSSFDIPVFGIITNSALIDPDLILRELIPPSRPPAHLHS